MSEVSKNMLRTVARGGVLEAALSIAQSQPEGELQALQAHGTLHPEVEQLVDVADVDIGFTEFTKILSGELWYGQNRLMASWQDHGLRHSGQSTSEWRNIKR